MCTFGCSYHTPDGFNSLPRNLTFISCLHRCGDILLEVNGKSTWGMTHTALVRFLKELRGRITLTIVSWPGSLL